MRTRSIVLLAGLLAGTPALAQVQPGNPNAANESLARQGEMRSLQQGQTSQSNATRMEIQRNELTRPAPSAAPAIVVPKR
ncbi:hypothetical protein [Methylobacterium trifolii]|uniref:Uncharacterized protein n=1 Tax=Methylobacterium trifolii TaxID=1003092 RepID=A0ABQ4U0G9_9HYPH|nr:hypothetical protein [Methylobacterium trifolii]GJE60319.1 hypothetical protein MPOCJGCO_2430 [Methylobacterium trifolii]